MTSQSHSMTSSHVFSAVSGNGLLMLKHKETDKVLETLRLIQAKPEHRSFILSTWVKSYAPTIRRYRAFVLDSSPNLIHYDTYMEEEPLVAEAQWENSLVAVDMNDDFVIHAWVCGSPCKLWHVYVPPPLRQKGIARALIKEQCGEQLGYSKPWPFRHVPIGWKYNPWLNQQKH